MPYGLLPQTKDDRDLRLGQIMTQPTPEQLPRAFRLKKYTPKDQKDSDFCAAFAATTAIEETEGVSLCPEFAFALGKLMTGDPDSYGMELRDIANVLVRYGALEALQAPRSLENTPHGELRHIETWGDIKPLLDRSAVHKQASYAATKGASNAFGNITSWMWKNRRPVLMGALFGELRDGKYLDKSGESGHAVVAVGWDGDYLIVQNSYSAHQEVWVHRSVVEEGVNAFGSYQFTDITPEMARYYAETGVKADQLWLTQIVLSLYNSAVDVLRRLIDTTNKHTGVPPYPVLITKWAEAIRLEEGWYRGSRSWRNNNPGNLKWLGQKGTTGPDEKGFAIFESVEAGWNALQRMLYNAASGKSKVYKPDMNLLQFFNLYAPSSDDNNPDRYANKVARYMGVTTEVQISSFITMA